MKNLHFIAIIVSLISTNLSAQHFDGKFEARLTILEENETLNEYPNRAVAISFINHSDEDIFIPNFIKFIRHENNDLIHIYEMDSLPAASTVSRGTKSGEDSKGKRLTIFSQVNDLNLPMSLTRKYNLKSKAVEDATLSEIRKQNLDVSITRLLDEFLTKPLFLKKNEKREFYITLPLNKLNKRPGEYLFVFEPLMTKPTNDGYPNIFLGYKKTYPSSIISNKIYLMLTPMLRNSDEE